MNNNKLLIIPRIEVNNANALSSPYTIGFPAVSSLLGFMHALERLLNGREGVNLKFNALLISCHNFKLHTHSDQQGFYNSIAGTGNPLKKDGSRASFIPEARAYMEITLAIQYTGRYIEDNMNDLACNIIHSRLRIAGGDIIKFGEIESITIDDDIKFRKLKRKLMPGFVLIERRDLMKDAIADGLDAMDALLRYLIIYNRAKQDSNGRAEWSAERYAPGWIVPISTGFYGISDLHKYAENQRDPDVPHRFAEAVITLGEFILPLRAKSLEEMLWRYSYICEDDLYICTQNK